MSTPITPADFRARFPEFASLLDPYIQQFIDDAILFLDETRFNIYYNYACLYYVAHNIYMAQQQSKGTVNVTGALSGASVGDTSASFASYAPQNYTDAYFSQTNYGIQYLRFATLAGAGGFIV